MKPTKIEVSILMFGMILYTLGLFGVGEVHSQDQMGSQTEQRLPESDGQETAVQMVVDQKNVILEFGAVNIDENIDPEWSWTKDWVQEDTNDDGKDDSWVETWIQMKWALLWDESNWQQYWTIIHPTQEELDEWNSDWTEDYLDSIDENIDPDWTEDYLDSWLTS